MEMKIPSEFKLTAMNMKKDEITFKKYINFISLYTKNLLHMSLQQILYVDICRVSIITEKFIFIPFYLLPFQQVERR